MKKNLLFVASLALASTSVMAQGVEINNVRFTHISPDGKTAVSAFEGVLTIYDIDSEKAQEVPSISMEVTLGVGNAVSNVGIFAVSTTDTQEDASYYENQMFHRLPIADTDLGYSTANGITPDGSRICGNAGHTFFSDKEVAVVPVVWNRNATNDGYDMYTQLPYPTVDAFGDVPQYVTAVAISENGKVIAGQVLSGNGQSVQPIVYTENENGQWEYKLLMDDVFRPEGLVIPDFPGWGPSYPAYVDFMTEAEYAAYQADLNIYFETWEGEMPQAEEYMSEEEYDAYLAAMDQYYKDLQAWEPLFNQYSAVIAELMQKLPNISFNDVCLSADGKLFGTSCEENWEAMVQLYLGMMVLSTEDLTAEPKLYQPAEVEGAACHISYLNNDGIAMGYTTKNAEGLSVRQAWVADPQTANLVTLQDYVATKNPELGAWMKDNMTHTFIDYIEEWDDDYGWVYKEVKMDDVYSTGVATADYDFNTIVSFAFVTWETADDDFTQVKSYVLPLEGATTAITSVVNDNNSLRVSMDANGVITITGEAAALNVYDINGRLVYTNNAPETKVETGLGNGIYLIRAIDAAGNSAVTKAIK